MNRIIERRSTSGPNEAIVIEFCSMFSQSDWKTTEEGIARTYQM